MRSKRPDLFDEVMETLHGLDKQINEADWRQRFALGRWPFRSAAERAGSTDGLTPSTARTLTGSKR